jgi:hypothetical protein
VPVEATAPASLTAPVPRAVWAALAQRMRLIWPVRALAVPAAVAAAR